jgi:hypothetical protein
MKIPKLVFAFVSTALLFASAAIAGDTPNKATVRINQSLTVDGKTIDSGKYTAQWTGEGPDVQVTLMKGKNTVATFAAQVKQEPSTNPDDAIGTTEGPNGKQLSSIYPGGKRISLQLNKDAGTPGNSSPSR